MFWHFARVLHVANASPYKWRQLEHYDLWVCSIGQQWSRWWAPDTKPYESVKDRDLGHNPYTYIFRFRPRNHLRGGGGGQRAEASKAVLTVLFNWMYVMRENECLTSGMTMSTNMKYWSIHDEKYIRRRKMLPKYSYLSRWTIQSIDCRQTACCGSLCRSSRYLMLFVARAALFFLRQKPKWMSSTSSAAMVVN